MTGNLVGAVIALVLVLTCASMAVWWLRSKVLQTEFAAMVKAMAEKGLDEIGGQKVEKWLDLLNHDSPYTLAADDTVVVRYKGEDLFFIEGAIGYDHGLNGRHRYSFDKSCFLLAVSSPAVRFLSDQEQLFGKIAGSSDLAAFGIRRYSDFVTTLISERKLVI
jgi:hypothetical protein